MRRNFADILKSFNVDITREYNKLFDILYESRIQYGNSYSNLYNPDRRNLNIV